MAGALLFFAALRGYERASITGMERGALLLRGDETGQGAVDALEHERRPDASFGRRH